LTVRYLGCALQEPDPRVVGRVLDDVPVGHDAADAVRVHAAWRQAAESELRRRLDSGALKIWLPVALPTQPVLPIFGGSPTDDWVALAAMVLKVASLDAGDVRIVDFTGLVADALHPRLRRYPGAYVRSELGPGGSIDPLLGITDPQSAAEVLADVVRAADDRSGRNSAAKAQNLLLLVTRSLDRARPVTIGRALAAVECALHGRPSTSGMLAPAEEADVVNAALPTFQQRPAAWDQLFEIESILRLIEPFEATRPPYRSAPPAVTATSTARGRIALQSLSSQATATTRELGADLLAARLVRDVRDGDAATTTMVLGADVVPERMLDAVARAASANGAQVVTVFERLTDTTESRLGAGGAPVAGVMRLANHQDAARAADYLGRRHSFVLAGVSTSETRSFERGWTTSTSTGTTSTTTRSLSIANGFSTSTSHAFARSRSATTGQSGGSSVSSGRTVSHERVYEHLLEPAVFQGLGPGALLLVDAGQGAARLVTCSRDVARSPLVDWDHYVEIGDGP
jgi:hypothetical protein